MTTWLIAIGIGPVQDFIAASRKARDLWCGSTFLSAISAAAARQLDTEAGLIFPSPDTISDNADRFAVNVANKLLATTTAEPAAVVARAREAATAYVEAEWQTIRAQLRDMSGSRIDWEIAADQVRDFLEWNAAWVVYDPAVAGSYATARTRVERLLAGRKALRDFAPAHGLDQRPKSALDPSLESIFTIDLRSDDAHHLRNRLRLKHTEHLDAISLVKRQMGENRFPSTSRIALDPWIRRAHRDATEELATFAAAARNLQHTDLVEPFDPSGPLTPFSAFPYDCQLVYAESGQRAISEMQRDDVGVVVDGDAHAFIEARTAVNAALGTGASDLPAYYAILLADGDRMGVALDAIAGQDAGPNTPESMHRAFSSHLAAFATRASETVANHHGALVYSGGDDVLAFLPVDTAIPCARALRDDFAGVMATALGATNMAHPTLSVGIAIGHYGEHLQIMLDRARTAERAAKVPRNALAVSFAARSGGGHERTVVHPWEPDPLADAWGPVSDLLRHDLFPDGAIPELRDLARHLKDAWDARVFESLPDDAFAGFVTRQVTTLLARKRAERGSRELPAGVVQVLHDRLAEAGSAVIDNLQRLADQLAIARVWVPWLGEHDTTAAALWGDALREATVYTDTAGEVAA